MNTKLQSILARSLGAIWIFDGLLQFQPQMFGQQFVKQILVPCLQGQPRPIQAIVHLGIVLWNTSTVWTDTTAALLQTAIGILLFFPLKSKALKVGLWLSIIWGLIVWACGEGFGMLLTGGSSFYTGAPGAVMAYVLLSVFLLAGDTIQQSFYAKFLGWSFIVLALLQLQPTFWTSSGIQSLFMGSGDAIGFLSAVPTYLASVAGAHVVVSNILLLAVLLVLGWLLVWRPNKWIALLSLVFLFFVWWLGQDLGQLSSLITGVPTDPNTAPLLALFLIPIFVERRKSATP